LARYQTEINEEINNVEERIDGAIADIENDIANLNLSQAQQDVEFQKELNKINVEFDAIEASLDKIDNNIVVLENNIGQIADQQAQNKLNISRNKSQAARNTRASLSNRCAIKGLAANLVAVNTEVTDINSRIDANTGDIKDIEDAIALLDLTQNADRATFREEINKLQSQFKIIDDDITKALDNISTLEDNVAGLDDQLAQNKLATAKNALDVAKLENDQMRQDAELALLSRLQLSTNAKIDDINDRLQTIDDINDEISRLQSDVADNQLNIQGAEIDIARLRGDSEEARLEMEERLNEQIQRELNKIDSAISEIESDISLIETDIGNIGDAQKLAKIETLRNATNIAKVKAKQIHDTKAISAQLNNIQKKDEIELITSAFLVDDFSGHKIGDIRNRDYLVAIDRTNKELRPYYKQSNFKLLYDFPEAHTTADKVEPVQELIDYTDPNNRYFRNNRDGTVIRGTESLFKNDLMVDFRPGEPNVRSLHHGYGSNSRNLISYFHFGPQRKVRRLRTAQANTTDYALYIVGSSYIKAHGIFGPRIPAPFYNMNKRYPSLGLTSDSFPAAGDSPNKVSVFVQTFSRNMYNKVSKKTYIIPAGDDKTSEYWTKRGYTPHNLIKTWYALNVDINDVYNGGIQLTNAEDSNDKITINSIFSETTPKLVVNESAISDASENTNKVDVTGDSSLEMLSLWEGEITNLFDQKNMSQTLNVQPFEVTTYAGDITLSPSSDEWIDSETRPEVIVNDNGALNAIQFLQDNDLIDFDGVLGTEWNAWQRVVQGVDVNRSTNIQGRNWFTANRVTTTTTTTTGVNVRTGTETTLGSETIEQDLGERVVDVNIIPFIRSRYISFKATGLKPGTPHYAFFDGEDVSDYCAITPRFIKQSESTNVNTYNGEGKPNSEDDNDGIITTSDFNAFEAPLNTSLQKGDITGIFRIPNNSDLRFKTGQRTFKLTSSPYNDDDEADSVAEAVYNASGLLQTKESQILSTRVPTLEVENIREVDPFSTSTTTTQTTPIFRWWRRRDPVAQTFFIDENNFKNGVFINDVDLFFAEKPEDNVDVQIYIVPTELGIPTQEVIPGSRVIVPQENVNVSGREPSDPNKDIVPTNFRFDYPIHLKPNTEYALIVYSTSVNYRVWTSVLGQKDIRTENTITTNSSIGVLLKSQNKRTWTPDQTRDLAFKMNRCIFSTTPKEFTFTTADDSRSKYFNFDLFNLNDSSVKFSDTNIQYELDFLDQNNNILQSDGIKGTFTGLKAKENIILASPMNRPNKIRAKITLSSDDPNVSPIFDLERFSIIGISNSVNSSADPYDRGYITQSIPSGEPSTRVRVSLDINKPNDDTLVKVYVNFDGARTGSNFKGDSQELFQEARVISANGIPTNKIPNTPDRDSFLNVEFERSRDPSTFTNFKIKIVFENKNGTEFARVKNLQVFSLK
jgi:predicted  nucleic acid-binding Zn-ribbon protein